MFPFPGQTQGMDVQVPSGPWKRLSEEDKNKFIRLRHYFHQMQKTVKDHFYSSFSTELEYVIEFTDYTPVSREDRCAIAGLAIAGPFIAVNTRQLMAFLGRCKSSINGSLQNLGYQSLRSKTKSRECVLAILPSFEHDSSILRQWTIRRVTDSARICFLSRYPTARLPTITAADLIEEKKPRAEKTSPQMMPVEKQPQFTSLPIQLQPQAPSNQMPEMSNSYSVECFTQDAAFPIEPEPYLISHSNSTMFLDSFDWSWNQ